MSEVVRTYIFSNRNLDTVSIEKWLKPYGFNITLFSSTKNFFSFSSQHKPPELVILDVNFSEVNEERLVNRVRNHWSANTEFPIIICSANDHWDEIALALYAGADDYFIKPLCKTLFLARLFSVMRRYNSSMRTLASNEHTEIQESQFKLSVSALASLSENELKAYKVLKDSIGVPVTRESLTHELWPFSNDSNSRPLDLVISRLRNKLKKLSDNRLSIVTHYGKGYSLIENPKKG